MDYRIQYGLAVAATVTLAGLAVIQAGDPAQFGLSPTVVRWMGVVSAMLGAGLGFLPRVTKPPSEEREGLD